MKIHGWNKMTLLDYPGQVAVTLFTGGCNFRCPFCQNGGLVLSPQQEPEILQEDIFTLLKKRKGLLDGVCITGGEPTLQEDLSSFIREIKKLGYLVKLDTNGYRPEILQNLIDENLLDMVAMDIKSSKKNYGAVAGLKDLQIGKIEASVEILKSGVIPYEFRTTVVRELHSEKDMEEIGEWLSGAKAYYLQAYRDSDQVIHPGFHPYSMETMVRFRDKLREKIENVEIRGME